MKTNFKVLALSAAVSAMLFGSQSMAAVVTPTLTLNATIEATASVTIDQGVNANITSNVGMPATSTQVGAAAATTNNATLNFTLPASPANVALASLFTLTYSANSGTLNSVDLTSAASTIVNGGNTIPYTLTCTAAGPGCSQAAATALPAATGGTGIFDTGAAPVSAKVLTFQLDTALGAGGTDALPAGVYSDVITVTVTAQ